MLNTDCQSGSLNLTIVLLCDDSVCMVSLGYLEERKTGAGRGGALVPEPTQIYIYQVWKNTYVFVFTEVS